MEINTGIPAQQRAAIAHGLSRLLADTYVVYLKTHNFHWNVEGPMFAPGTYQQYLKLASIEETDGVPEAEQMVKLLIEGQEAVARTARELMLRSLLKK